jgi:hypothetical protein
MDQKIIEVKFDDRIEYHLNSEEGPLHRQDGPAIIYKDGSLQWWVKDRLHCLDGPACINDDNKQWWVENRCHRVDGPAIIKSDGCHEWWVRGIKLNKNQVNIAMSIISDMPIEDTMLYIGDSILVHFVNCRLKKRL